jgi:hypothetical protein
MEFIYSDGGRGLAGFKGKTGDCVTRAIAIATEKPYQEVYDSLNQLSKMEKPTKGKDSASRTGVFRKTYEKYLKENGWKWVPCMKIGQGCQVHLRKEELPNGRLIVSVSRHLTAVIDGVIHDNHDCSRNGNRCVYGYYIKEN